METIMITIYIIAILISMFFVIKAEDWSWLACFIYLGLCAAFTLPLGIFLYKFVFKG